MTIQTQLDIVFRVLIAALLASAVGYNRQHYDHPAGLRTHILIGIGASLFTAMSLFAFGTNNPGIVAAQIVTGIGFLGAGSIIRGTQDPNQVHGVTTAAGVWTTAALGMTCGAGLYLVAVLVAILTWIVLDVVGRFEKKQRIDLAIRLNTSNADGSKGSPPVRS